MPCTPSYCDLHDYAVSPSWCNYAYANAPRVEQPPAISIEQIKLLIREASDEVIEELRDEISNNNRYPRTVSPTPRPQSGAFKGVDV